jgi:hypothetical protein
LSAALTGTTLLMQLADLLIRHKVGVVEKALKVISLDEEWWGDRRDWPLVGG